MSRRSKTRERRAARRQSRRNQIVIIVVGSLLVGVGAFFLLSGGDEAATAAPNARAELDPVLGNPDAPVTIVEYGAYSCPSCRAWHNSGIIDQILEEFPDQVNFVFRDFPVITPTYDRMAANVAQCALDQSEDGFWRLHDAFYTVASARNSEEELLRLGERVGLDYDALKACAEADTHEVTVEYDHDRARELGLPGTPSFLVNGERIFYATPEVLREAVIEALGS